MTEPTVVIAHPSADLYGSDRQMLSSVAGLRDSGWEVVVAVPGDGPLVERIERAGGRVHRIAFPVVRKSLATPRGVAILASSTAGAVHRIRRFLRETRPEVVLINTVTIPVWLAAARVSRVPAFVHVHEAEQVQNRAVRTALYGPLHLAAGVVANSQATLDVLREAVPRVAGRATVVLNGIPVPDEPIEVPNLDSTDPLRLALVSRLTARKGIHTALEAVATLRGDGLDVVLDVCGTPVGEDLEYDSFLRERVSRDDLAGAVEFLGYVDPVREVIDRCHIFVMPTMGESFGNAAAEALMLGRPVVASDVQGLREVVDHGSTGLLVSVGDPAALADAVRILASDPGRMVRMGAAARRDAVARFSEERYQRQLAKVLEEYAEA